MHDNTNTIFFAFSQALSFKDLTNLRYDLANTKPYYRSGSAAGDEAKARQA